MSTLSWPCLFDEYFYCLKIYYKKINVIYANNNPLQPTLTVGKVEFLYIIYSVNNGIKRSDQRIQENPTNSKTSGRIDA